MKCSIFRSINRTHPTAAKQSENAIMRNQLGGHKKLHYGERT